MNCSGILFGVLFFLLFTSSEGNIKPGFNLIDPPGKLKSHYLSGPLNIKPKTFNVTGRLVFLHIVMDCIRDEDLENLGPINDTIVFVMSVMCLDPPHKRAQALAKFGAAGMIQMQNDGCVGSNYVLDDGEEGIPAVTVAAMDGYELVNYFGKTTITNISVVLTNTEVNPWWQLTEGPAGIIIQIMLLSYCLVCIVVASYKLRQFIQLYGMELSVTQVCLSCDIIASALRLVLSINPFTFHGFWSPAVSFVISILSIPVSMAGTLLMTFYWNDILSTNGMTAMTNLHNTKIQYAIAVVVMSVTSFAACITVIVSNRFIGYTVAYSMAVLILTPVAIFFIHTGRKVITVFKQSKLRQTKSNAVTKLTILMMTTGAAIMCYTVSFILLLIPANGTAPVPSFVVIVFHLFSAISVSFFMILAFQIPTTETPPSDIELRTSMETIT